MRRRLWTAVTRGLRAAGRRLTPPGTRVPVEESREQHPPPGSGGLARSPGQS